MLILGLGNETSSLVLVVCTHSHLANHTGSVTLAVASMRLEAQKGKHTSSIFKDCSRSQAAWFGEMQQFLQVSFCSGATDLGLSACAELVEFKCRTRSNDKREATRGLSKKARSGNPPRNAKYLGYHTWNFARNYFSAR